MPIKNLPKIKIGNYPYGQFAGGYIYSLQLNQGYTESRNEIKIDVLYDKDIRLAELEFPKKSLINKYKITIGNLEIPAVYFIEHSISISPTENIASFTFTDESYFLDTYYVGLVNRHISLKGDDNAYLVSSYCSDCENKLQLTSGYINRITASSRRLQSKVYNNLIIVGEEEFSDQSCDIPDVKYSFSDLLYGIADTGKIVVERLMDINPDYKTSYVGTLREVLSNWCSDFGFSFYWDFFKNRLIGIDLRNPVELTNLKDLINREFSNNSNLPISNYSVSESLNGTYQQDYVDFILKPIRVKEKQIKEYFTIDYSPIRLNQFLPLSTSTPDMEEVILAKYSPEARVIYTLTNISSNLWFEKIGFIRSFIQIPQYILSTCLKNINDFIQQGGSYVVGVLDENKQNATNTRYASISDKIGRYYLNNSSVNWNDQSCSDFAKFEFTINYQPSPLSTINPFADVGGQLNFPPAPYTSWIIERSPTYVESNNNFNLESIGPIYTNIDGEIADQIRDLDAAAGGTLGDSLRGKTIIAFRPLGTNVKNNVINEAEENFIPEAPIIDETSCKNICDKDAASELCEKFTCNQKRPGYGLVSKFSTSYTFSNPQNGSYLNIIAPAEQPYIGYIESDGTFSWTENAIKSINLDPETNFKVSSVLQYSVNLNDVTMEEPMPDGIDWDTYPLNSKDLKIKQDKPQEKISLKIIGTDFGALQPFINTTAGLSSLNVYINDNGAFTDLTFDSRPPQRPKPEVIMRTISPQKMRIIK
jgi:hypothetical protein